MTKYISIDPGKYKCGLIFADFDSKTIHNAIVIESQLLVQYIKNIKENHQNIKVIMGNGTSSKEHAYSLRFLGENLLLAEEKNTTFRAKQRYFEIHPIKGLRRLLPKDVFLYNINLDAVAALIILEDFLNFKFAYNCDCLSKTWLKQ